MANSIKREGIKQLNQLATRVARQYNLPGTNGNEHRISLEDKENLILQIGRLITYIENMQEDSPDLKVRPF
jgi:hypothetical protein